MHNVRAHALRSDQLTHKLYYRTSVWAWNIRFHNRIINMCLYSWQFFFTLYCHAKLILGKPSNEINENSFVFLPNWGEGVPQNQTISVFFLMIYFIALKWSICSETWEEENIHPNYNPPHPSLNFQGDFTDAKLPPNQLSVDPFP